MFEDIVGVHEISSPWFIRWTFLPKQFAWEVELHLLVHHFRDDTGGAILDELAWLQWHGIFLGWGSWSKMLMRHDTEL